MPKLNDRVDPPLLLIFFVLFLVPEAVSHRLHAPIRISEPLALPVEPAPERVDKWRTLKLVATAYNSLAAQTDSTPDIAAWGDKLKPGMKAIAVSRDLLRMGLDRGTRVRISGLEGEYVVLDKMNKRWTKRIDVYMGEDVRAALNYGKRDVVLQYRDEKPLLVAENN